MGNLFCTQCSKMWITSALLLSISGLLSALETFYGSCPDGWFNTQGLGCFKFLSENVNWMDAHYLCEVEGGFLSEPASVEIMSALTLLASVEEEFTGISAWWIGLGDFSHEGSWVWAHTGQGVGQTFWSPGSPHTDTANREDCVFMELTDDSLEWRDIDCEMITSNSMEIAPLCQMENDKTTTSFPRTSTTTSWTSTTTSWPQTSTTTNWPRTSTTTSWTSTTTNWPRTSTTTNWPRTSTTTSLPRTSTSTSSPECPLGWSHFEGKCFQAVLESMDWMSAREFCQAEGAELGSIHSSEEHRFIARLLNAVETTSFVFWLGGTDSESEGQWQWSDGTYWDFQDPLEEYGGTAKNCLKIEKRYSGIWYDVSCFSH